VSRHVFRGLWVAGDLASLPMTIAALIGPGGKTSFMVQENAEFIID
jgi:hypothetical protein